MILKYLAFLSFSGCLLNGCAPVVFMGATSSVATSMAQERGLGGVISDVEIKARILSLYTESELPLGSQIDVMVHQGKVLLTGIVDSQRIQMEAVRLAWIAKGVKEVHDEIQVGNGNSVGTMAKDSWISTQLKTKILFDEKISSINYNLQTIEGVVYIMGIAKTQAELDHFIQVARNTSGVRKVVSYVRVSRIADEPQATQPIQNIPSSADDSYIHPINEPIAGESQESLQAPNASSAFD